MLRDLPRAAPPRARATPPPPGRRGESLAAAAACLIVSVAATWRLLRPDVLSADALVHLTWMWHFRDAALFADPLTDALRESGRYPPLYQGVMWLAVQAFDPIGFGEWLGVVLMALSGWLVFGIVREREPWRPAAWIGAALFLALIEIHRFNGGFPRAFIQPVVLATVLLALRGRLLPAAVVAGGAALVYPPSALLAVGVLGACALRAPPRWIDRRHLGFAVLAGAIALAGVVVPELLSGHGEDVLSAAQARAFPDFGPHGPLHFFVPSTLGYLRQNRSGFDLRTSGSIVVVAAAVLLLARRDNWRLLGREVLAMPVVALGAFAVAQAVLFRLYLPHRYTYPLVGFAAIAIAVTLRPTWEALGARRRVVFCLAPLAVCAVAVWVFPLAPPHPRVGPGSDRALVVVAIVLASAALGAVLRRRVPTAAPALAGLALVVAILVLPGLGPRGNRCPQQPVTRYLSEQPKDSVIAGDPRDLMCVPATTRRPVVISTQLAPSYEPVYFRLARARMFADLRAYYGPSRAAIGDLWSRYGVTDLMVRRNELRRELQPGGVRWPARKLPFGRYVRGLVAQGEPAALRLPRDCRRWARGAVEVYDVRCIARRG